MPKLRVGDRAPDFTAKDTGGKDISLSGLRGKNVVLYFYPKDDTPGCTKEACSFRDELPNIKKKGTVVLGVSMDNQKSHEKFTEKHSLNFQLLSDAKGDLCSAYGVYGLKSLYGRQFFGIKRTTFVIDKKGRIMHIFEKVKPEGHAKEVLEVLER